MNPFKRFFRRHEVTSPEVASKASQLIGPHYEEELRSIISLLKRFNYGVEAEFLTRYHTHVKSVAASALSQTRSKRRG